MSLHSRYYTRKKFTLALNEDVSQWLWARLLHIEVELRFVREYPKAQHMAREKKLNTAKFSAAAAFS